MPASQETYVVASGASRELASDKYGVGEGNCTEAISLGAA